MGSDAHLVLHGAPSGLAEWAVAEVERLERLWSRFLPDSDLSQLNAAAGRGPHRVHPLTFAAVQAALDMHRVTDGLFDPTILDALIALGYDRTFREIDRERSDALDSVGSTPGIAAIVIDPDEQTVSLPAGVHIDLGGIGKGMAADMVAEGAIDRGGVGAAVGLGGDVRIAGRGPDSEGAWDIHVEHPLDESAELTVHRLEDSGPCAIVTSTKVMRTWRRAGETLHHLIDPRTGTSAVTDLAAVVVAGPEAGWSEVMAKAALIAGSREGAAMLGAAGARAWLVHDDGMVTEVHTTNAGGG
ncbi:MAG: FAD:protein FMN transferase [Acidimicrobiia bacterium]